MFRLDPVTTRTRASYAAAWLRRRGARPGDRVAVVASNRPGYVELTMGALCTGVVPVLLNPGLSEPDLDVLLADADPLEVVTDDTWPSGFGDANAELSDHPLGRPMHYTSGTTGRSKGVWSGVLTEADAAALAEDEAGLWGAGPGDVVLVCSPLYHSAPHRVATSALLHGASVVVFEKFDAAAVAASFRDDGVTGAFLVPTHLRRLLDAGLQPRSARRVLHAGEPCPPALKRRALEAFGSTLWEFYGSTEGQFSLISPDEWLERPGSVGRARPGRSLHIHSPTPDAVGPVYVTAPAFARWVYWRDEDKTAAAWNGHAFTVGDLGRLDDDGYLYLEGRREDLVISGGVNVYPAEVERVLLEHPGIAEAAVFGVPDERYGQRVCAAVVAAGIGAQDVVDWARQRLPGSHRPKQVLVVDTLPRTPSGKVRRADLTSLVE